MNRILSILSILFLLQSCSPKIRSNLSDSKFPRIEDNSQIFVLGINEKIPENSRFVGDLKVGDSGFSTDCGYETVIENAKMTAKKSGANLIQLIQVKEPNLASTCYRIQAKLYRNLEIDELSELSAKQDLKNRSRLPDNANYANVYFYRPKNFAGSIIGYKIRLDNDSIIGRVRNGEKFEFKTSNYGKHTFYGVTESKDSVVIDIKKGQEYFVRCGIKMGIAVGRPKLQLVDNNIGIGEYDLME